MLLDVHARASAWPRKPAIASNSTVQTLPGIVFVLNPGGREWRPVSGRRDGRRGGAAGHPASEGARVAPGGADRSRRLGRWLDPSMSFSRLRHPFPVVIANRAPARFTKGRYRQFHTELPVTAALLTRTRVGVGDFDGAAERYRGGPRRNPAAGGADQGGRSSGGGRAVVRGITIAVSPACSRSHRIAAATWQVDRALH